MYRQVPHFIILVSHLQNNTSCPTTVKMLTSGIALGTLLVSYKSSFDAWQLKITPPALGGTFKGESIYLWLNILIWGPNPASETLLPQPLRILSWWSTCILRLLGLQQKGMMLITQTLKSNCQLNHLLPEGLGQLLYLFKVGFQIYKMIIKIIPTAELWEDSRKTHGMISGT